MSAETAMAAASPAMSGEDALLAVKDLTVRYGGPSGTIAVRGVSFTVGYGERVALVGESGSGKTSLGLAVAGFLTDSAAHISFESMSLADRRIGATGRRRSPLPRKTAGISMMFQDAMTSLDPQWTIGAQMRAVLRGNARMNRTQTRETLAHWLQRVGLADVDRVLAARPYELSGGMRQRVMLATVLCGNPRLIIADEPTSALDASVTRQTMELLTDLSNDLGTSLLIISHDINMCLEYAQRTLVMYQGDIVDAATSTSLAAEATHPYTRGLLACIPRLDSRHLNRLPTLADYMPNSVAEERMER